MAQLLLLASIVVCLCAIYKFVIYPAILSPLAKIPNAHFSSAISPIWILWVRLRARENRTVLEAHERYGPVLRLGPNELSVNCVEGGLRTVYGGGFEKGAWYNAFWNYGVPSMFSTEGSKEHSAIKKLMSNVYSKSFISSSPIVDYQTSMLLHDRLLPILDAAADSSATTDVVDLYLATTMDFITAFIFGSQSSSNFLQDENARKTFLGHWHNAKKHLFWIHELPRLTQLTSLVGINLIPASSTASGVAIEDWCMTMCDAVSSSLSAGTASSPATTPIVYEALTTNLAKERTKPSSPLQSSFLVNERLSLASEALDHLGAGFETSGITLTYLTHELSLRPELQTSLRAELRGLTIPLLHWPKKEHVHTNYGSLPDYRDVDALPLLHAILLETLRLHAAIPGIQPRMTPQVSGGLTLGCGEHVYTGIPAGVRVQASAHALHRNREAFPDAHVFRCERWLESDKSVMEDKKTDGKVTKERAYWAFGSGGRMCVGSNFAIHEMKMVIAAIYTNFKTSIVDDDGIEQLDGYTVGPRSGRLLVRFERISEVTDRPTG